MVRNMDHIYIEIITNNILLASWEKPIGDINYLYKGEDIGYNTDALNYYKNM